MKLCLPLGTERFLNNDPFLQGGLQNYVTRVDLKYTW